MQNASMSLFMRQYPTSEDFVIQNHYQEFLHMYAKSFHVSTKDLHICTKDPTNDYYTKLKQAKSGCFAPCAKTLGMEYVALTYTCTCCGAVSIDKNNNMYFTSAHSSTVTRSYHCGQHCIYVCWPVLGNTPKHPPKPQQNHLPHPFDQESSSPFIFCHCWQGHPVRFLWLSIGLT